MQRCHVGKNKTIPFSNVANMFQRSVGVYVQRCHVVQKFCNLTKETQQKQRSKFPQRTEIFQEQLSKISNSLSNVAMLYKHSVN